MKKIFSFLLLGLLLSIGNAWADQVTLAYSGSSTTNMTGNNDATIVGLDANHWSVVGNKGGNTNYPGLNKAHDIRLYYHANGSNTITVENLDGATINSITVAYVQDYENGKVLVNSQEVTGNNGTYAINSSSFVITNGNTSNIQVRFTSIQINYTPAASNVPVIYGAPSSFSWGSVLKDASIDAKTFNLSGANLTGAITLTATGGYTVSPTSITPINGDIAATEITITPPTTSTAGTKNGTVTISGGGLAQSSIINLSLSVEAPLTVAQARVLIDGGTGLSSRYVAGIVSQVDSYSSNQITYWISDDGSTTNQMEVYKGKNLNNTNFTSINDLKVGDIVIVFGNLTLYDNTTYEFGAGNYLVYFERPVVASIDVVPNSIEAVCAGVDGTIEVTYNNITDVVAEVYFCNAQGDAATYDWVAAEINAQNNVDYIIEANTGAARTAYMKVHALDNNAHDVYSELITISQKAYVPAANYVIVTDAADIMPGAHYIIANGTNGGIQIMGEQRSNNRGVQNVTAVDGVIDIPAGVETHEFVICKDGDLFAIYEAEVGYLYAASSGSNYLKSQATNNVNGQWEITIDGEDSVASIIATESSNRNVMRYNSTSKIFSCYGSATQGDVYLYRKTGESFTTETVTVSDVGYATLYYGTENLIVPEGVVARTYKVESGALVETKTYEAGEVVPKTIAVVLEGAEGIYDFIVTPVPGMGPAATNLKGSDVATTTTGGDVYYALSLANGSTDPATVGFYWMIDGGAAFTNGAHKAYLALGATQAPARYYVFNEENNATDIQNVEGTENAVKFIENGKLYIQKNGVVYDAMGKTVR